MFQLFFVNKARRAGRASVLALACFGAAVVAAQNNPTSLASADDVSVGAKLAAQHCAACHGVDGQGSTVDFPSLAGQNEKYIVKQLRDFASGVRKSAVMDSKAAALDERAIQELAKFYQSKKPQVKPVSDPALAAVGAFIYDRGNPYSGLPACVSCHGTGARGRAELPRLAGQSPVYLERQLHLFADKGRANDAAVMSMIAKRMNELEMKAVAEHLGAMK